MNTFDRTLQVFQTVFQGTVAVESITMDSRLREDAGIHSIGMLYMAMALESEFGVKFKNEDFQGLVTVGDVVRCIDNKLQ